MNVKTLQSEESLIELEYALQIIKWDIIGLCEISRIGEATLRRENKHLFANIGESKGQRD